MILIGRGARDRAVLGLVASPWVDQTRGHLLFEHMIQTSLIAANAGIDLSRSSQPRLAHQIWIRQNGRAMLTKSHNLLQWQLHIVPDC